MSNLYMYQFEDIAWDELCLSDDHIVPHPGPRNLGDCFTPGGSLEQHVRDLTSSSRKTSFEGRCIGRYVNQGREQSGVSSFPSKRRKATFEKDSWLPTPNVSFDRASDREMKNGLSLASDGMMLPSHGSVSNNTNSDTSKFCGRDSVLCDKSTTIDNSSFSYFLGEIDHASNDLGFLNNADNNDSDGFLYHGWPEIGNFEDVDKMFSNCNSTFDLAIDKEEEFGRLPPTDGLGVSGYVLKSDVKFPSPQPNVGGNILENTDSLKPSFPDDTSMNNTPIGCKDCYWTSEEADCIPFLTGTAGTDYKDGFSSCIQGLGSNCQFSPRISAHNHSQTRGADMINETEAHSKMHNQAEGQSKGNYFGNDGINHIHGLPNEVMQCSSLNVQESLPSNSGLDDISVEAASFLQLQLVIEQMGLRTKLCIRDSLYRLAQSAGQRANSKPTSGDEKASIDEGTNKCSSFVNGVETNTNPLDRSVAHLLFHRRSDSSPRLPVTHFH